ncbi:hypothetical protein N6H14_13930 [Paenibacillus sp. CC-CFT747]|nr:hypothetical protein N6H14_13930 [Paenibacillus sp. CC-CFT747]
MVRMKLDLRTGRLFTTLILLLALISTTIFSVPQMVEAAGTDLQINFENYKEGPLNGQQGWSADVKTTVTSAVYHQGASPFRFRTTTRPRLMVRL